MSKLANKTDEIAALEKYKKLYASATTDATKKKFQIAISKIKKGLKGGDNEKQVTAKQLAASLLSSRKKFIELSKKDFQAVIKRLMTKPEYQFLRTMTKTEIIDDINRKAKPVGWRFKGRADYRTPSAAQVKKGRKNGTVYYENRPNRSDVSQSKQLEKGGSFETGGEIYKKGDTVLLKDGNSQREGVVIADGIDSKSRVRVRPKGFPMDMSISTIENDRLYIIRKMAKGGSTDENPVIRYYFEDEEFEYAEGGDIDLNDLDLPVHYTMFEEEFYEYGKGGNTNKIPKLKHKIYVENIAIGEKLLVAAFVGSGDAILCLSALKKAGGSRLKYTLK